MHSAGAGRGLLEGKEEMSCVPKSPWKRTASSCAEPKQEEDERGNQLYHQISAAGEQGRAQGLA